MTTDNRRSHKEAALKHGKLCLWEFFPGKLKLLSEAADVAVTFPCIKESAFRLCKGSRTAAVSAADSVDVFILFSFSFKQLWFFLD